MGYFAKSEKNNNSNNLQKEEVKCAEAREKGQDPRMSPGASNQHKTAYVEVKTKEVSTKTHLLATQYLGQTIFSKIEMDPKLLEMLTWSEE